MAAARACAVRPGAAQCAMQVRRYASRPRSLRKPTPQVLVGPLDRVCSSSKDMGGERTAVAVAGSPSLSVLSLRLWFQRLTHPLEHQRHDELRLCEQLQDELRTTGSVLMPARGVSLMAGIIS